jgi:hypothetical protein
MSDMPTSRPSELARPQDGLHARSVHTCPFQADFLFADDTASDISSVRVLRQHWGIHTRDNVT